MTAGRAAPTGRAWRRPSTWVAGGLLAVSWAMIAFTIGSVFLPGSSALPDRPNPINFVAALSVFVALPTVGAVLAILRPANPIGWLFLVGGAGYVLAFFSTEYVGRAVSLGVPLPAVAFVDWMGAWVPSLCLGLLVIWVPLHFPDGSLPGPRWRPVAWIAGATIAVATVAAAIASDPKAYSGRLPNPIGAGGPIGEAAATMNTAGIPLVAVLGIFALSSLVVRFRRAQGVERQQLKWFLLAVGFLFVAVVAAFATQLEGVWYAVLFGLAALPISAGIAVMRYHLYDIDRIISRTVAYASVTAVLAVVFVGAILLFQAILSPLLRGNAVAVAASTLVVATLFQPLRRGIQSRVDRRFNRARYDAEQTVAAFSARLRNDVDLESLRADVQGVVERTVAPASVALWMRPAELKS